MPDRELTDLNSAGGEKMSDPSSQFRCASMNDPARNATHEFPDNTVVTAKYNALNFFPKTFFEQFRKVHNVYFLVISVLQLSTNLSPTSKYSTALPLTFVLSLSLLREGFEDYKRHKDDKEVNHRTVTVAAPPGEDGLGDGTVEKLWKDVAVGDLVLVRNGDEICADLIVIATSEDQGMCYVETSNLDGETNLKIRQALEQTQTEDGLEKCRAYRGQLEYEQPNNRLYNFDGKINLESSSSGGSDVIPLDAKRVMLRGVRLRNTQWVVGHVIFTGVDTKLVMNSRASPSKQSNLEKTVNKCIMIVFCTLALLCVTGCLGYSLDLSWGKETAWYMSKLPPGKSAALDNFESLGTFLILFNNFVPISLQVTMEMVKLFQAFLIEWDETMYYEPRDMPALARTSNLNEDLGQIEYIFSDKTGTLTRNEMEFRKCSINGNTYGYGTTEIGEAAAIREGRITAASSGDPRKAQFNFEDGFGFDDERLLENLRDASHEDAENIREFLLLLGICHTIIPEKDKEDPRGYVYQAASPDEGALVLAARCLGFEFHKRVGEEVNVKVLGEDRQFTVIAVNEFNSTRKRMSVVVRMPDGKIMLYLKGADNVVEERLAEGQDSGIWEKTTENLVNFANEGLRTLVCARREIPQEEFDAWFGKFKEASTSLENRGEKLDAVAAELEVNLELVGATAIEDKLQAGVPDAIAKLAEAGIKIWVLTGDKQETAINIGFACRLLTDEMQLIIINEENADAARRKLRGELEKLDEFRGKESDFLALVIDGQTLNYIFDDKLMQEDLLELGQMCKAVVCCRVSPLQKAQIVGLVKKNVPSQPLTLAVGDGANDVSMIQEAHVGIGISGNEGMQAVQSADYAIAQFRFLQRLLMVHGTWDYKRTSLVVLYSFYKNITYVVLTFFYTIYNGWSGASPVDSVLLMGWNVVFTFLPIVGVGVFDKDITDDFVVDNPGIYIPCQKKTYFNPRIMGEWVLNALVHAIVLYFCTHAIFESTGGTIADNGSGDGLGVFGFLLYTAVMLQVNYRCALLTNSWNWVNHFFVWGTIVVYFIFAAVYDRVACSIGTSFCGVAGESFSRAEFWMALILIPLFGSIYDVIRAYVKRTYFPQPLDIIQEMMKGYCEDGSVSLQVSDSEGLDLDMKTKQAKRGSVIQINNADREKSMISKSQVEAATGEIASGASKERRFTGYAFNSPTWESEHAGASAEGSGAGSRASSPSKGDESD